MAEGKKKKKIDLEHLTPEEELKLEVAEEIGVLDKVLGSGWGALSAKETGKIGGILSRKKREMKAEALHREEEADDMED